MFKGLLAPLYAEYVTIFFFLAISFFNNSRSGKKETYANDRSKHYYAAIA